MKVTVGECTFEREFFQKSSSFSLPHMREENLFINKFLLYNMEKEVFLDDNVRFITWCAFTTAWPKQFHLAD